LTQDTSVGIVCVHENGLDIARLKVRPLVDGMSMPWIQDRVFYRFLCSNYNERFGLWRKHT